LTELSDLWAKYTAIEQTGNTTTKKAKDIEARIHELQKNMGTSRYDFDKRRERLERDAVSSVSGPPDMESKVEEENVPQARYTFEQAREQMSDNDFNILEECAQQYEIKSVLLAHILNGLNPDNQTNHARRGQGINWAITEFYRRKDNK